MRSLRSFHLKSLALVTICIPLLAGLSGCVTSVIEKEPLRETTLLVSRSGQTSILQWETEPGMLYTVLHASTRSAKADWQVLPGYARITGTGQTITAKDEIPAGQSRHYRLHVERAGTVR